MRHEKCKAAQILGKQSLWMNINFYEMMYQRNYVLLRKIILRLLLIATGIDRNTYGRILSIYTEMEALEELLCTNASSTGHEDTAISSTNKYSVSSVNDIVSNTEDKKVADVIASDIYCYKFFRVHITASLKSIMKGMRNMSGGENGLTTEIIKHAIDITGRPVF